MALLSLKLDISFANSITMRVLRGCSPRDVRDEICCLEGQLRSSHLPKLRFIVMHFRSTALVIGTVSVGLALFSGCSTWNGSGNSVAVWSTSTQSSSQVDGSETLDTMSVSQAGSPNSAEPNVQSNAGDAGQAPDRLVQDPPVRSARKLDFSSGSGRVKYRSNFFVLQAFNEAIGDAYKCTVQLHCQGDQCALGTIVDADGWIVTKASELAEPNAVKCVLNDQRELDAKLVGTDPQLDVALLKVQATGLKSIEWDYQIPEQGRWLATVDVLSSVPTAIGVVSTGPTKIPNQKAVLGVLLDDNAGAEGARVSQVLVGSGADEAGLRERDTIVQVDGKKVANREQFLDMLRSGRGGQFLNLLVDRDDQRLEKRVRLMDLSTELLDETEMEVNGPISARSTGFGRILIHDTVLLPNQCGGPLLNLSGKAVGINIARAGRVATYALPADILNPVVMRLMQQANVAALQPGSFQNAEQPGGSRVVLTESSGVTPANR